MVPVKLAQRDVTPAFHPAATRDRPVFDGPPVSHPGSMLASSHHLPGLTPVDDFDVLPFSSSIFNESFPVM
tara:strand:- start:1300 stop:1512 length:213 start_codon:yes stop_codon:yes gene_type:complete